MNKARLLALLACALMIASAYTFQPVHDGSLLTLAALLLLSGTLLLLIALRLDDQRASTLPASTRQAGIETPLPQGDGLGVGVFRPPSNWSIAALGILGMALLAAVNGGLFAMSIHVQFALLCVSLALLIWGLAGERVTLPVSLKWRGHGAVRISSESLLVTGLTVLALLLRYWALEDSVHYFVDELSFAEGVTTLSASSEARLLAPFAWPQAFPWLFPYLQAGTVALFGHNLTGLRAVSALMGTLTILALYLLARPLFDRKTAFIAALLLATFPPHIHFSRIGFNNIADPLFGTLALAFLARGLRTGRRVEFAAAGVTLGLTHYFYEGGRLLFLALTLLWITGVFLLWRVRSSCDAPFSRRELLVFALAALVVAVPIYTTLLTLEAPVTPRLQYEVLGRDYWLAALLSPGGSPLFQQSLQQFATPFLMLVHFVEAGVYYGGETPIITVYLVPVFFLGIAYALWRWRTAGGLLALLWIALTLLGNSLLFRPVLVPRYIVVFPALALAVALGIRAVIPLIFPQHLRKPATAVLVGGLAVLQMAYYFGPHLSVYNRQLRLYRDGQDAIFRSQDFPPNTQVHVIGVIPLYEIDLAQMLRYLRLEDLHVDVWWERVTPQQIAALPRGVDHAFFLEPENSGTLELIRRYFDLEPPQYSPYNVPRDRQLILYYAPSS
jgi:4-amino-4-deoxy-L-arabinose transferase-like glycosyltransferase